MVIVNTQKDHKKSKFHPKLLVWFVLICSASHKIIVLLACYLQGKHRSQSHFLALAHTSIKHNNLKKKAFGLCKQSSQHCTFPYQHTVLDMIGDKFDTSMPCKSMVYLFLRFVSICSKFRKQDSLEVSILIHILHESGKHAHKKERWHQNYNDF